MKANVKYELVGADDEDCRPDERDGEEIELMDEPLRVGFPQAGKPTVRPGPSQGMVVTAVALISCYFILSISLTFYQRWLLKDFHWPLSVVLYHLVIKFIISFVIRVCFKMYTGRSRVLLDWRTSVQKVLPTGFASGIDIGL
jgi:hypothetical protein